MSKLPWRPRAAIPRQHKTIGKKIHSVVSVILFIFCLLYIVWWGIFALKEKQEIDKTPKNAIAILLDTSLSMASADIKPNRYDHALGIVWWLLRSFDATYFTIPYWGIPILRTPISADTFGIQQVISEYTLWSYHTSPSYLWSAPGNAIWFAWDLLSKIPADRKTILLIGDGNTNTGFSIDTFIPRLQQDKIDLLICTIWEIWYTIGVDYVDTPIISERNVARLDYITSQTKGKWRVCNDKNESIKRITMQLKDTSIFKSKEKFFLATRLQHNPILQTIAIASLAYFILIAWLSFIRYLSPRKH